MKAISRRRQKKLIRHWFFFSEWRWWRGVSHQGHQHHHFGPFSHPFELRENVSANATAVICRGSIHYHASFKWFNDCNGFLASFCLLMRLEHQALDQHRHQHKGSSLPIVLREISMMMGFHEISAFKNQLVDCWSANRRAIIPKIHHDLLQEFLLNLKASQCSPRGEKSLGGISPWSPENRFDSHHRKGLEIGQIIVSLPFDLWR